MAPILRALLAAAPLLAGSASGAGLRASALKEARAFRAALPHPPGQEAADKSSEAEESDDATAKELEAELAMASSIKETDAGADSSSKASAEASPPPPAASDAKTKSADALDVTQEAVAAKAISMKAQAVGAAKASIGAAKKTNVGKDATVQALTSKVSQQSTKTKVATKLPRFAAGGVAKKTMVAEDTTAKASISEASQQSTKAQVATKESTPAAGAARETIAATETLAAKDTTKAKVISADAGKKQDVATKTSVTAPPQHPIAKAAQPSTKPKDVAKEPAKAADAAKESKAADTSVKPHGKSTQVENATMKAVPGKPATFVSYFLSHETGRGLSMWSNALDAYQRHLAPRANQALKLAESGVKSGGSIQMWEAVLGSKCQVYGMDDDPATKAFEDNQATISTIDSSNPDAVHAFFRDVTKGSVDVFIDESDKDPAQRLTTFVSAFDNVASGGLMAVENIYGEGNMGPFWGPASDFLGRKKASVFSVHIYPYMFLVQRAGGQHRPVLKFKGSSEVVKSLKDLRLALWAHPGGHVIVQNTRKASFLERDMLKEVFAYTNALHHKEWTEVPEDCTEEDTAQCIVSAHLTGMQTEIVGVHVYPRRVVVEVAPVLLPRLMFARVGSEWTLKAESRKPEFISLAQTSIREESDVDDEVDA